MTLPRLYELEKYWDLHPPVGDLVAAYLDYKPQEKEPGPRGSQFGSLEDLIADFTALGGKVN